MACGAQIRSLAQMIPTCATKSLFPKKNGAFDPVSMGSVPNFGLMAQKAEEYCLHDKTFEAPSGGKLQIVNSKGEVATEHSVEAGDFWRACQIKDSESGGAKMCADVELKFGPSVLESEKDKFRVNANYPVRFCMRESGHEKLPDGDVKQIAGFGDVLTKVDKLPAPKKDAILEARSSFSRP